MTEQNRIDDLTRQVQTLAEQFVAEGCEDLFATHGCTLGPVPTDNYEPGLCFCAVIGFSGAALRGSLVLGMSQSALGELKSFEGSSARDVLGELSNQLLGRLKNKLLRHDVELFLTIPVVLRGEHFAAMPRIELNPHSFRLGSGSVWVWVELECFEGFEMRLEPSESEAPMAEGDALLF